MITERLFDKWVEVLLVLELLNDRTPEYAYAERLSKFVEASRSTIKRSVQTLLATGLIEVVPDKDKKLLPLTETGKLFAKQLRLLYPTKFNKKPR